MCKSAGCVVVDRKLPHGLMEDKILIFLCTTLLSQLVLLCNGGTAKMGKWCMCYLHKIAIAQFDAIAQLWGR